MPREKKPDAAKHPTHLTVETEEGKEEKELAYGSVGAREVDFEEAHSPDDGHHGLDGVGVDDWAVGPPLLLTVPRLVDDLHLLHDRRLPTLPGPCTDPTSTWLPGGEGR